MGFLGVFKNCVTGTRDRLKGSLSDKTGRVDYSGASCGNLRFNLAFAREGSKLRVRVVVHMRTFFRAENEEGGFSQQLPREAKCGDMSVFYKWGCAF